MERGNIYLKPIFIIGAIFFLTYFVMMFIKPWFDKFSWDYVHNVWLAWQTLNAGMVAFVASIIALYSVKYSELKKRQRELGAAKAMFALSLSYITEDAEQWMKEIDSICFFDKELLQKGGIGKDPIVNDIPEVVLSSLNNILFNCDDEHYSFIARYVNDIQVIRSRIKGVKFNDVIKTNNKMNLKVYLMDLVKLQAKTNRLFGFSRGKPLYTGNLTKQELNTSFSNLSSQLKNERLSFILADIKRSNYPDHLPVEFNDYL